MAAGVGVLLVAAVYRVAMHCTKCIAVGHTSCPHRALLQEADSIS